jgi:hypothetical protein
MMEKQVVFICYEAHVAFLVEDEDHGFGWAGGSRVERSHTILFTANTDEAAIASVQRWTKSRQATGMFGPVSGVKVGRAHIGPIDRNGNLDTGFAGVPFLDWKCDRGSFNSKYSHITF